MPQQGDWLAARDRLNSKPMGATSIKPTPPKSIPDHILQWLTGITNPATATTTDIEQGMGPADITMAALPFFGRVGSQVISPLHNVDDLARIAGLVPGEVNLYHGTKIERAADIMREGFKPLQSGEAAARQVADLYEIPWKEWTRHVEPGRVGAGYGVETAKVSSAPYPIAARWASHFPQGEVLSQLNDMARMYRAYKDSGSILNFDAWVDALHSNSTMGGKIGIFRTKDPIGESYGFPDRMSTPSGGAILGLTIDNTSIPDHIKRSAQNILRRIEAGNEPEAQAMNYWNNTYRDIKIDPKVIRDIQLASPRNTALARSLRK